MKGFTDVWHISIGKGAVRKGFKDVWHTVLSEKKICGIPAEERVLSEKASKMCGILLERVLSEKDVWHTSIGKGAIRWPVTGSDPALTVRAQSCPPPARLVSLSVAPRTPTRADVRDVAVKQI